MAFVHLPAAHREGGISRFALIDHDGYYPAAQVAAKFTLPVISGIGETESMDDRRARIHRVLEMLKEIGPLGKDVSEIDVADPNNLIVAEHVEGSVVNLMLGDENYAERMQNFLDELRRDQGEAARTRPRSICV